MITAYVGSVIETMDALEFVRATGYKGIIANGWRDPARAIKALPWLTKVLSDNAPKI